MLTQQRHEIILKLLKEKGSITVTEVRDLLDTSESTVRRDITALDKEGKLEKVFGGAVEAGQKVTAHEYTVAQKNELNCDAKRKIAEYAASLIEPDDFVFLDAGTTTAHMIDFIRATSAVFVTNAVDHARRLASRGFKVILVGGELKSSTEAVVGNQAIRTIQEYHFTKGFFGTNGVTRRSGCTPPDADATVFLRRFPGRRKSTRPAVFWPAPRLPPFGGTRRTSPAPVAAAAHPAMRPGSPAPPLFWP